MGHLNIEYICLQKAIIQYYSVTTSSIKTARNHNFCWFNQLNRLKIKTYESCCKSLQYKSAARTNVAFKLTSLRINPKESSALRRDDAV